MRSPANTARLSEQNPTLMRLGAIEAVEKVAEQGRLSGVVGLAGRVVKLASDATARPADLPSGP